MPPRRALPRPPRPARVGSDGPLSRHGVSRGRGRPRRRPKSACNAFAETYRGKLGEIAAAAEPARGLPRPCAATRRSRICSAASISYAGLVYAGDTTDPARAKFYGDAQERLTDASSDLLFFELELNRLDDALLDAALADPALWPLPALDRGHPQGEALPARRPAGAALPREVGHRPRRLEPAVRRDDVVAALQGRGRGADARADPQPAAGAGRGRAARPPPRRWPRRFSDNLRVFTLITNTLAKDKEIADRWRGFEDVADSRHLANRVEREVVDALVSAVRDAYPRLSHRYYALKAKWFGKDALNHWDRNAPLPKVEQRTMPWPEARDTVLDAYRGFSPELADIAGRFFDRRLDRRAGAAGQGAGRLRASDRALGAPLRAAQLPGQAARRDDARPRARPRRAPGAGRAERRADGADAADAGRDRLRVRRDADLPRAARRAPPTAPERKAMLAAKVEDMINTVVRQIAFYSFEREVHRRARQGELTADEIGRDLAGGAERKPRPGDPARPRLRDLLGLYPATSSTRRSTSTPMRSATAS